MTLLGIAGAIGSGKDVIASYLQREHGYVRVGMSDALKDEVGERLRETVKEILRLVLVADPEWVARLPAHLAPSLGIEVNDLWWSEVIRHALWTDRPPAIRRLLQEYGSEVRRADDADYWVTRIRERLARMTAQCVVCPDVRFWNEATMIRGLGGALIRVERPGRSSDRHQSEHGLDAWSEWDAVFLNDGTTAELEAKMARFMGSKETVP